MRVEGISNTYRDGGPLRVGSVGWHVEQGVHVHEGTAVQLMQQHRVVQSEVGTQSSYLVLHPLR
jgi:hypothetical protein